MTVSLIDEQKTLIAMHAAALAPRLPLIHSFNTTKKLKIVLAHLIEIDKPTIFKTDRPTATDELTARSQGLCQTLDEERQGTFFVYALILHHPDRNIVVPHDCLTTACIRRIAASELRTNNVFIDYAVRARFIFEVFELLSSADISVVQS